MSDNCVLVALLKTESAPFSCLLPKSRSTITVIIFRLEVTGQFLRGYLTVKKGAEEAHRPHPTSNDG